MTSAIQYRLHPACPETVIVSFGPDGITDYSAHGSAQQAWLSHWDRIRPDPDSPEEDAARHEFLSALTVMGTANLLDVARRGASWPVDLGYVIDDESDDVELD